jgi:hypothetical protein
MPMESISIGMFNVGKIIGGDDDCQMFVLVAL